MLRAIGLALACWGVLYAVVAVGAHSGAAALTVGGLLLSALLVLVPAALALTAGRALQKPFWAVEVIASWAVLGYLLALVDPSVLGHSLAFALVLPALFGACASPGLLIAAWVAPGKAAVIRKQAYLLAALPAGFLLLRGLDALAPLTAILFCLLLFSAQLLFVSSLRQPRPATEAPTAETAPPAATAVEVSPPPTPPVPAVREAPTPLRPVIAIASRARLD